MTATPTTSQVPGLDDKSARFALFVMAKLRKVEDGWPCADQEAQALRIAVLGLVAHAIELGREGLACSDRPIAGLLLLRTLWHNAGHLAWLLHGPGALHDRLVACADDQSIRTFDALVDRTRSVFGDGYAKIWFRDGSTMKSIAMLQREADEARSRQQNPRAPRSDWRRLTTSDLSDAMKKACDFADAELKDALVNCLTYTELAKMIGDDMAHPNPFVALQVLDLLDGESGTMRRTADIQNGLLNRTCLLLLLVQLLVLHVVALSRHDPNCMSLHNILETIGRAWARGNVDNAGPGPGLGRGPDDPSVSTT